MQWCTNESCVSRLEKKNSWIRVQCFYFFFGGPQVPLERSHVKSMLLLYAIIYKGDLLFSEIISRFFLWNENNPTGRRGKVPIKLLTLLLAKVTFFFFFFFFSATELLEVVVVEEEAVATFTTASVFSAFAAFTPPPSPVFVGKAVVVGAFCEDEVEFETSETTSNMVETTIHEKMINGRYSGFISKRSSGSNFFFFFFFQLVKSWKQVLIPHLNAKFKHTVVQETKIAYSVNFLWLWILRHSTRSYSVQAI